MDPTETFMHVLVIFALPYLMSCVDIQLSSLLHSSEMYSLSDYLLSVVTQLSPSTHHHDRISIIVIAILDSTAQVPPSTPVRVVQKRFWLSFRALNLLIKHSF
jgi:hypothetical protein